MHLLKTLTVLVSFLISLNSYSVTNEQKKKVDLLKLLEVQSSDEDKEILDKMKLRRTMLNWHKYTAWTSVGLMIASLATASDASKNNKHKVLGISSGVSYLASASLAYLAPRPEGIKLSSNISIHEKLAWIHAPAMLLTMYSGIKADSDVGSSSKSSIGKSHKLFAGIAAVSFGLAAITSTDWSVNILPTRKKGFKWLFTKNF